MKKEDIIPAALLIALIPIWLFVISPRINPQPAPRQPATDISTDLPADLDDTTPSLSAAVEPEPLEAVDIPAEEVTATLTNEKLQLTLTSIGAGIKSATLLDYPELNEKESDPVLLDFSDIPALSLEGIKGLTANDAFAIEQQATNSVTFTKTWESGIAFQRTITLGTNYLISVSDRYINNSEQSWNLPPQALRTGFMSNPETTKAQKGVDILGVDTYSAAEEINYWGKKLAKFYKNAGKPTHLKVVPDGMGAVNVEWVAAKNKFFAQILSPENVPATPSIISNGELVGKNILPKEIAAALHMEASTIISGSSEERNFTLFIGPKKYTVLKATGDYREGIMEFQTIGFFHVWNILMEPARRALLWTLNLFHSFIPNYGIAIILLTILIRILFWPLTHKSTESMRRMQEIQPLMKEMQAKYKDKPKKMQEETMKLYREHKVNPMGGCLPMIIQIPVFIALFTVLRNAIELRYAGFLWINDLSSPENLFAGSIPLVGALNILPLLMAGSMYWQQKMTPTAPAATPEQQQQQKMMMVMMPFMMLFFFYTMPSGLVLYWTVSQLIAILQMSMRNKKRKTA